ncbi:hypothetical protein OEZ86_012262 [Tetradesmus obliquus]|nr:hypothetical protein OEZ86_012262 [Tetradesmus obliquus]
MVEGVAAFPSMQQLQSSSGRLYLFIEREADAALLSHNISNPTRSVRGAQIAASLADFQDGLRGRLLCDGTAVGPQQEVSADQVVADVRFADYIQPTGGAAGYNNAWPGDVVLKIRNLPQPLHKPGVAAAVLQAAGYDAQVLVGDHYRDAATALAVADDSSEEVEMVPVLSKSQRQRRRAHRRKAAAAVEQQILQQQQQQQQRQQQQEQQQQQQQQQQQMQQQQQQRRQQQQQQQRSFSRPSRGPERIGLSVLDPPAQAQPFPVSFEREEDARQRLLARQQAQLIAELENTAVHSDDATPSTSDAEYDIYEMGAKYESTAAWLKDEGVLVSSDDIDVIPDSDSEYEEPVEVT